MPARAVRAESKAPQSLRRELGLATAISVVVGNVIGSGIFTTSGFIARDVGSPVSLMVLWLAGGVIALAGALCYSELGAAMPRAGGEYVYLAEAYGTLAGFLSGWTSLFIGFSGAIAAATLAFADYLGQIHPGSGFGTGSAKLVALITLWVLTGAHAYALRVASVLQRAFAVATVGTIVILLGCAVALGQGSAAHFCSSAPVHGSAAVSLIFVLYSYSGWNAASYIAEEIRDVGRNLPRALVAGTGAVTVLYLALNAMYIYALPINAMSGVLAIAQKASVALFGPLGACAVAAILSIAIIGSANAMLLASPRVFFAMARDGFFPVSIAACSGRGALGLAILCQGLWVSVLIVFFGAFEPVIVYTGFAITIFTAMAVGAIIVLRRRRPESTRKFQAPGYPWMPVGFMAVSLWVVIHTGITRPWEALLGAATVANGFPMYWICSCFHQKSSRMS
jgi:APA family basic amino acid/polyamine antiporter